MKICAYGELLMRLNPPASSTFSSLPSQCELYFGGAETNFLANGANLGTKTTLLTVLPDNPLGKAALKFLGQSGIDTRFVKLGRRGRMGIYFLEEGAGQRGSQVIYDRKGSSINYYDFSSLPFRDMFSLHNHYHITGITPALSEIAMYAVLRSVRLAKEMGLMVSCDLNYREQLWRYKIRDIPVNKEEVMSEIVSYCDFLFGNEIDLERFFYDDARLPEYHYEQIDLVYYENLLLRISTRFPRIRYVAISTRKSENAAVNAMGGVLFIRDTNQFYFSPNAKNKFQPFVIDPVIDRIGSGDAFASGFIIGLHKFDDAQKALDFAVASSVLKHSYRGDTSFAGIRDLERLMDGNKFGRIWR